MDHACQYKDMLVKACSLREMCQFCDVDLQASDGVTFKAHRIILAAASKVIHNSLLSVASADNRSVTADGVTLVKFPDMSGEILEGVVQIIYGIPPTYIATSDNVLAGCKTLEINTDHLLLHKSDDLIQKQFVPKTCGEDCEEELELEGTAHKIGDADTFNRIRSSIVTRSSSRQCVPKRNPIDWPCSNMSKRCTESEQKLGTTKQNRLEKNRLDIDGNSKKYVNGEDEKIVSKENKIDATAIEHKNWDILFQSKNLPQNPSSQTVLNKSQGNVASVFQNHQENATDTTNNDELAHPDPTPQTVHAHYCELCSRGFTTNAHFEGHQNVHKGLKPHHCSKCPNTFAYSISLKRHEKKCNGLNGTPKSWLCSKCQFLASTLKEYTLHMRSHRGSDLTCNVCQKQHRDENRLESHMRSVHGPGNVCTLCGKHIQSQNGFGQHMQTHERSFRHNCKQCGRGFHNLQHYEGHLNKHHGRRPYICTKCGLSFGYGQAVRAHEQKCGFKVHSNRNSCPGKSTCDICGLMLKNARSLQAHKLGKHANKEVACDRCGKHFTWRQSLNRHRAVCKGPPEEGAEEDLAKVHGCSLCERRFKQINALKEHIRAKHEAPRFACSFCSAQFHWKSLYYRHRQRCHAVVVGAPPANGSDSAMVHTHQHTVNTERQEVSVQDGCQVVEELAHVLKDSRVVFGEHLQIPQTEAANADHVLHVLQTFTSTVTETQTVPEQARGVLPQGGSTADILPPPTHSQKMATNTPPE